MQKHFLRLLHLGQNTFWQLLQEVQAAEQAHTQSWQQALGATPLHVWIKDAEDKYTVDFLALLQELSLPYTEHSCQGLDHEALEAHMQSYDGANALNILCGFSETEMYLMTRESKGAWFNGVSTCACPWAALSEAAFAVEMSEKSGVDMDTWRICWMGAMTPLAQSLMEAAIYTPYELFMGIPSWSDPDHSSTDMALKAGAKVFMTREPRLAIDDAHIIYMDVELEAMSTAKTPARPIPIFSASDDYIWQKGFSLNDTYKAYALQGLRIVATEPMASYAQAEADLQQRRAALHRASLLATLHYMLSAE